jgi:hypothetical protein
MISLGVEKVGQLELHHGGANDIRPWLDLNLTRNSRLRTT